MAKNIVFIINPVSGHSPSMDALEQLVKIVKSTPSYHLIETEYSGHATELAKEAIGNYQVVVAVGGDGTINEVVSGIANSNIELGIIPQGSGNGLAHHLGIPKNWQETLLLIEQAEPKPIDIISVNNRLVVNVGGIGFDGHVAKLMNNSSIRGGFGYMKFILKELYTFKEFSYSLRSELINVTGKAFIIAIANGSEFGNRFKVAVGANHNDGKFNLVIIRKPPFLKLLTLLIKGYQGKLKPSEYYQNYLMQEAEIEFTDSVAHVDGEIDEEGLSSPLHIHIKQSALKVYY